MSLIFYPQKRSADTSITSLFLKGDFVVCLMTYEMTNGFEALQRVVKLVGSKAKVAEIADVTPQAVAQWTRIPTARVLLIEKALDGDITRQEMRPDIYPD